MMTVKQAIRRAERPLPGKPTTEGTPGVGRGGAHRPRRVEASRGRGETRRVCATVGAAGVNLRLEFTDPVFAAEFAARFGCVSRRGRRSPVVAVLAGRASAAVQDRSVSELLDGCGAYRAGWDARAQRGWVWVSGRHRVEALANAVRRLLRHRILPPDALVLHAACVEKDGMAYVFAGRSGAGKTTASGLVAGGTVLSDDMTVLRRRGRRFLAWGLPGPVAGVGTQGAARGVPLNSLLCLVKARVTRVAPLSPALAAAALVGCPAEQRPGQTEGQVLESVSELVQCVPCFELRFRKDSDVWAALLQAGRSAR